MKNQCGKPSEPPKSRGLNDVEKRLNKKEQGLT